LWICCIRLKEGNFDTYIFVNCDNAKCYNHVCNVYLIMWSFFQIFFAVGKGRTIFEIVLSTVATISFIVIVMFAVIIRRLHMKNMTYREIEQGEFCNNRYPISFITFVEHSDCCNKPWKGFLVVWIWSYLLFVREALHWTWMKFNKNTL
jgi:hypothetical protein